MNSFVKQILRKPRCSPFRRKKRNEKDVATKSTYSALEDLPAELKQQMSSFLSVRDLFYLEETSKCMKKDLGISVMSSPLTDQVSQSSCKRFQTGPTKQNFSIVIPNQESQSYATTFRCKLESKGNSDGIIWIVEQDLPKNPSPEAFKALHFKRGKIVASASATPTRELVLPFFPKIGKLYQLWINTQGTVVHLHKMTLSTVGLAMKPYAYAFFQSDDSPINDHL
ncbi:unnamed protein product [Cylindrotheca closterium]|uniref:F-box domain-containing protein n=1 Tax=Cylindrotheca closterium TaxID=2856 RepID=A0AAD2G3I5_9STRA|nr:unnamed protein product [Cylindrotheca closterium]